MYYDKVNIFDARINKFNFRVKKTASKRVEQQGKINNGIRQLHKSKRMQ